MNAEIARKYEKEITSCGAAIAAGLHVGYWESLESVEQMIQVEKVFTPDMTEEARKKKTDRYAQAIERSIGFGWAE